MSTAPTLDPIWSQRWQRFSAAFLRSFHRYATWLVGISWKKFILLSVGLMVFTSVLTSLPPFSWKVTETIEDDPPPRSSRAPVPRAIDPPPPPDVPARKKSEPIVKIERPASGAGKTEGIDISIDENGIRITPKVKPGAPAASAGAGAASAAAAEGGDDAVTITLPPGVDREAVREALNEARDAIREAIREQKAAAREAARAAREAAREAREAGDEAVAAISGPTAKIKRVRQVRWGEFLTDLALLWIMGSAIIKATYKGRIQAETKAALATETAEAESLRRQVVEARMAAMQAQVEPHFLFNTLASIDHLIETDPARASQMQKNLIALLRASMPTLREADGGGVRQLGRELAVIRPYLEILKVRMEERLATQIDVPDGLLSAEFPPMMMQTLVENAIKHGLEPKPEGGHLTVRAEIVHGKLQVSVIDTGLGFGRAATAGTGVGLANVRERLQLLYGAKGSLTVTENPGGGTCVAITVPYRSLEPQEA